MAPEPKPRRVLVVGGSQGVGEAVALLFARLDFEVVISGRDEKRLYAAAKRMGPKASAWPVDARDRDDVRRLFEQTGEVEHLVLAFSGGQPAGPFVTMNLERLREGFESKFWAHVQVVQAALQAMQPKGSITFVTSATASSALPSTTAMAAINGALQCMIPPLAVEVAPVRVNAVAPGVVDTPVFSRMPQNARETFFYEMARSLPVKRIGRADEIAEAVYFVATNGFMTGETVIVDGGAHLTRLRGP